MICLGEETYKPALMEMWKLCFPQDTDEFIRFYFDEVYRSADTLVLLDNEQAAASLQIIPYPIKISTSIYQAGYISGAMTHPAFRRKGYMAELLKEAFVVMKERGYGYSFLIPQEDWLFDFYEKYGYEQAFPVCESSVLTAEKPIRPDITILRDKAVNQVSSLKETDLDDAYSIYYGFLTQKPNVVLKTKKQFSNLLEDLFIDGGSLFINDWGILFALPENDRIFIKEFFYYDEEIRDEYIKALRRAFPGKELILMNDPAKPFLHYKGMIKPINETSIPQDIYMRMMLD